MSSGNVEITPIGSPEPLSEAERRWAEAADSLEFGALARVRGVGEKWAASLTGVLGVVGLTALIEGQGTFDGLADTAKRNAQVAFLLAIVLTLTATALATYVSQIAGKRLNVQSGTELRKRSEEAVDKGLILIRWSQGLALAAVAALLVAGSFLWLGDSKPSGGPTVIEVPAKSLFCGEINGATAKVESKADYAVHCLR